MREWSITMSFSIEHQTTQISNIFIDEYMPKAHPPYVMVYLYAYSHISNGDISLTNQSIAEVLDLLESDVIRSWKYWQKQGLITLSENGNVHFLPVQSKKEQTIAISKITQNTPPQYTQQEMLAIGKNSPTAKKLFALAEYHLARTLSYKDMNIVLSFHEWLGLSLEVIELLFTYCNEINKHHLSYIEKVAVGWAEEGITTPQRALEYIQLKQNGYKQIMKTFGQNGRMPAPAEEKYIKKWLTEYHFTMEMILIACEKTILQTGNASFHYANKILKDWHSNNIKTPEDVENSDKNFHATKQNNKQNKKELPPQQNRAIKQNRFVNYEQRQWDFKELERLERERLERLEKERSNKYDI